MSKDQGLSNNLVVIVIAVLSGLATIASWWDSQHPKDAQATARESGNIDSNPIGPAAPINDTSRGGRSASGIDIDWGVLNSDRYVVRDARIAVEQGYNAYGSYAQPCLVATVDVRRGIDVKNISTDGLGEVRINYYAPNGQVRQVNLQGSMAWMSGYSYPIKVLLPVDYTRSLTKLSFGFQGYP